MAEGQSEGAGRTGVCRHCGALVGAGEARCMVCGTPVAREVEPPRAAVTSDTETLRFLRAVISRPATFTFVFLIANVFLYLLMWLAGGATGEVLIAYGAKLNYLIDQEGQWWRFVTPIFLHMQLPGYGWLPVHLLLNMYGLFVLGQLVERLYGSARFVVLWVLTGVAGVAASYLAVRLGWAYDVPAAGASGALFGLMGVLFVFGIRYREELPEDFKPVFGLGLLPVLLLNLFIGYIWPGVAGNTPHVGGLLAGMGLGLLVGYNRPGSRAAAPRGWQAAQAVCLALVVLSFMMVARHFDTAASRLPGFGAGGAGGALNPAAKQPFIEAINAGRNALARFVNEGDGAALGAAMERLEQTPSLSPAADALRDALKALLASARSAADDRLLDEVGRARRREQLGADFDAWAERFDRWVEEEGRPAFGIHM